MPSNAWSLTGGTSSRGAVAIVIQPVVTLTRAGAQLVAATTVGVEGVDPAVAVVVDPVVAVICSIVLVGVPRAGAAGVRGVDAEVAVVIQAVVAGGRAEPDLVDPGGTVGILGVDPAVPVGVQTVDAVAARGGLIGVRGARAAAIDAVDVPVEVVVDAVVALPGAVAELGDAEVAVRVVAVGPAVEVVIGAIGATVGRGVLEYVGGAEAVGVLGVEEAVAVIVEGVVARRGGEAQLLGAAVRAVGIVVVVPAVAVLVDAVVAVGDGIGLIHVAAGRAARIRGVHDPVGG
jgi:hypothetical protein